MFTCLIRYVVEPDKLDAFEEYAHAWIALISKHGGIHHGYFVPGRETDRFPEAEFSFPASAGLARRTSPSRSSASRTWRLTTPTGPRWHRIPPADRRLPASTRRSAFRATSEPSCAHCSA